MFKKRTLFILGAGASKEVNIPLGAELAKQISSLLYLPYGGPTDSAGGHLLEQIYARFPQSDNRYQKAALAIHKGVRLAGSIDDFLDRHNADDSMQRVGEAAIVKMILYHEGQSLFGRQGFNLDQIENTWFMKFFRMLGAGDQRLTGKRDVRQRCIYRFQL